MAQGHAVAVAIKQYAGEQARPRNSSASIALGVVAGEPRRNRTSQLLIDYRRVFAGMGPPCETCCHPESWGRALSQISCWLLGLAPIHAAQKRAQCEIFWTGPSSV